MPHPPEHDDTTDAATRPDDADTVRTEAPDAARWTEVPTAAGPPRHRPATQGAPTPPTLDDAFTTLGHALLPSLEDNLPLHAHVEQAMGIYADGNVQVGWQQLLGVLEGVLGTPLMPR